MTDPKDFEDELRDRLRDATNPVVAGDELQHRLVDAAATGRGVPPSAWARTFRSTWLLPAAAAVVTLLAAGSAVVAVRATGNPAVTHGTAVGTPTLGPPATGTPPLTPTTAAPTTPPPTKGSTRAATHPVIPVPPPTHQARSSTPPPSIAPSAPPTGSLDLCTAPAEGAAEPPTKQAFINKIVGTWLVCSQPSAFGADDAGLLINKDGTWARLVRNPAGALVDAPDLDSRGTWQVLDTTEMNGRPLFQLNFDITGGGVVITIPQFAAAVDRMHLDNNGVYIADYVPTSEPVSGG